MLVKYFIPEDGDDQDHPNAFRCSSSSPQITLGQIKKSFPIPGVYHFRFLTSIGNTVVWLDVFNDSEPVPMNDGNLIIKVSRIENTHEPSIAESSKFSVNSSSNGSETNFAPPPLLSQSSNENIIDFDSPRLSKSKSLVEDDLLGFNTTEISSGSTKSNSQSSSSVDLFGLDSIQPTTTTPIQPFSAPLSQSNTTTTFQTQQQQSNSNNAYFSMAPPPPQPLPSQAQKQKQQPMQQQQTGGGGGGPIGMNQGRPPASNHQRGLSSNIMSPHAIPPGGSSLGALDAFSAFNVPAAGRGVGGVQGGSGHNSPMNSNTNRKL